MTGDAVLVTVPVGVLQKGTIAFEPVLPPHKQAAISRMGFGLLNKVKCSRCSAAWTLHHVYTTVLAFRRVLHAASRLVQGCPTNCLGRCLLTCTGRLCCR